MRLGGSTPPAAGETGHTPPSAGTSSFLTPTRSNPVNGFPRVDDAAPGPKNICCSPIACGVGRQADNKLRQATDVPQVAEAMAAGAR